MRHRGTINRLPRWLCVSGVNTTWHPLASSLYSEKLVGWMNSVDSPVTLWPQHTGDCKKQLFVYIFPRWSCPLDRVEVGCLRWDGACGVLAIAWHCWLYTKALYQRTPALKSLKKHRYLFFFHVVGLWWVVQGSLGCGIMVIIYHSLECLPCVPLILRDEHFSLRNRFTLLRNSCLRPGCDTRYLHCYDEDNENSCWQTAV